MNFDPNKPVGAHTDAQGRGHVAAVFTEQGRTTSPTHLRRWFQEWVCNLPGESPIFLYELCDAILMVCCSSGWHNDANRTCVLCVDNKAAVATLVKCSSSPPAGTLLANLFWTLATRGSATWWVEYIHAKPNIADEPPSGCAGCSQALCSVSTTNVPRAFARCFSPWEALRRESTLVSHNWKELCASQYYPPSYYDLPKGFGIWSDFLKPWIEYGDYLAHLRILPILPNTSWA